MTLPKLLKRYSRLASFRPDSFGDIGGHSSDLVVYDASTPKTFYHAGDFGDILYALPTIRAMGGGKLLIGPQIKLPFEVKTRQIFTQEIFEVIAPLLALQSYVHGVEFCAEMPPVDHDLNAFREYFLNEQGLRKSGQRRLNLAEIHLWTFRLPLEECTTPWLVLDSTKVIPDRPVVIHRSARWRNPEFPWAKVLEIHKDQAVFVGLRKEHEDFCAEFSVDLPFEETRDFLELARIIGGSSLFIGNQSAPYAIAEGLKKTTFQEVWPEGPNCLFPRPNATYGDGKIVYIPKLKPTMTKEIVKCPVCGSDQASPARTRADIVQCASCQIVYLRTRPTQESLEDHYQAYAEGASHMRIPETFDEVRSSGLRREYFMEMVLRHGALNAAYKGALLDVGCGWGAFLLNARDKGFNDAVGVEIGRKSANFANSFLGLKVLTEQVENCNLPAGHFSVVTMIHVLEHLPYTAKVLNCVHSLLAKGGLFCGIVPNFSSYCSTAQKDKWSWLDPNMHYVHFTPETLTSTLNRYGFELVEMHTHTGDFSVQAIADQVQEYSNVPMTSNEIAARIEGLWSENLGEEIRFFARKICTPS